MKPYEKPRLIALSLSGNDMLCAGCSSDFINNPHKIDYLLDYFGATIETAFEANGCEVEVRIDSYCKFYGADSGETVILMS